MRFGYCTVFATPTQTGAAHCTPPVSLLRSIGAAGYSYVELPLSAVAALPAGAFSDLQSALRSLALGADVCTNLFPDDMPLTGPRADHGAITAYLAHALARAHALGTGKLVFTSTQAWSQGEFPSRRAAADAVVAFTRDVLLPAAQGYEFLFLIEPLRRDVCDIINTLEDGAALVRHIDDPHVRMMADTFHMLCNREDPGSITRHLPLLHHVHVVDRERRLPCPDPSPALQALLGALALGGYAGTIAFEPRGRAGQPQMAQALRLLQAQPWGQATPSLPPS